MKWQLRTAKVILGGDIMNTIDDMFPGNYQNYYLENKILGINGSPRRNGNSDFIMKQLQDVTSDADILFNSVSLRDYQYSSCIGCEKCRKDKICTGLKDGLSFIYPLLLSSKGLVLISPTHNYNVSAWMKAFIDRLYCFYNFENNRPRSWTSQLVNENRKAVIIGICEQNHEDDMGYTIDAMARPLSALGYEIESKIPIYGVFDRGAVKNSEEIIEKIRKIGKNFSESIKSN